LPVQSTEDNLKKRIKTLMAEVENDKSIILFIDEIHTIVGAGG
jgi:ATP-dependent Clp protease ATP-binding subunit ClpA